MIYGQILGEKDNSLKYFEEQQLIDRTHCGILITILDIDHTRDDAAIKKRRLKDSAFELSAGLAPGSLTGHRDLIGMLVDAPDIAAICKLFRDLSDTAPEALMSDFGIDAGEAQQLSSLVKRLLNTSARLLDLADALPAPDIILATDIESLIAGIIAKHKHQTQLAYRVDRGQAQIHEQPDTIARFLLGIEKVLVRYVDQGLAGSEAVADQLSRRHGVAFRTASDFIEMLAAIEPRVHREPDFGQRLLEQAPEQLIPTARAACEAYIEHHRLIEIKPLRVNGASMSRWCPDTGRVEDITPDLVNMVGGTVGLSVQLPYPTDLNCLFLSFDGGDEETAVEIESTGRWGGSAPVERTLGKDGALFQPWNGNLASRLSVRIKPRSERPAPRLRAIRIFTTLGIST